LVKKARGQWLFFSPPFVEKELLPIKRKAKEVEIFFIKKSKRPSKRKLDGNDKILASVLKQVWVRKDRLEKVLPTENGSRFKEDAKSFG